MLPALLFRGSAGLPAADAVIERPRLRCVEECAERVGPPWHVRCSWSHCGGCEPCKPLLPPLQHSRGDAEIDGSVSLGALTAAAEPLLEPPGVCSRSWGFLVGPGAMYANSAVTVFPTRRAPASSSLSTTGEGTPSNVSGGSEVPARVSNPPTLKMSLTPSVVPKRGGRWFGSG